MKLVILAGGFGTRLSEETDHLPKPMVKLGRKPIIWHIMKYYSTFGITDFIVCGGYKINCLKDFFKKKNNTDKKWNVKVVFTGNKSNTGERVFRVRKYLKSDFCLTYGDGLSDVNIKKLIFFHKKFKKGVATLLSIKPIPKYGKIVFNKNLVKKFYEKDSFREDWINGGFFVCSPKIFEYFKKKNSIFESDVLISLAKNKKLQGFKHRGFWYCMDTLRDKRHLNDLLKKKQAPWIKW
jgi:glucose-1-phosphate cytidylyltransferase